MHKLFIILLMLFLFNSQAQCATIVYPKKTEVNINAPHTFFIGNEPTKKYLKINNESVNIHKTGAFKHAVDLNYGENIFEINNGKEIQVYKIYRGESKPIIPDKSFKELTADENPDYAQKVKEYAKNENLRITIDAGHGGKEYGAIGCLGEKEKDINLKIAIKLKKLLEKKGYQVFMTRENDTFVGLRERVDFANNNNTHIFISIHSNALNDSRAREEVRGSEVYYLYPQAKDLSEKILESLSNECGMKSHGIYQRNFAVVRNPKAISVLVEIGYIIDPQDEEKLINNNFQDRAAKAILHGLENYLK